MSLKSQIDTDLEAALRAGQAEKVSTLRLLKSEFRNTEIAKGHDLSDEEAQGVAAKAAKQRRESIESYRSGGRAELAAKEEAELKILQAYLPEPLTDSELGALVKQGITELGISDPAQMGQLIGWVRSQTGPRADGGRIAAAVRAELSSDS